MFKILSWNIQQGGGSRTAGIAAALTDTAFDVIILSEFKNNENGTYLQKHLMKNGFHFQVVTGANSSDNTVLIATKHPGEPQLYTNADPVFTHNIATAKFAAFNVMGVYLPHKKKHTLLPFITNEVTNSQMPFIIAGDYNTGKNFIDQKGDSFWYQHELLQLEKAGYIDAYRLNNLNTEEYSWYSHQGNGYRYDHTYIHQTIAPIVSACYYLHNWRLNKLSDHSPMVLELGG
jgi:exodeoxyribonuclease III